MICTIGLQLAGKSAWRPLSSVCSSASRNLFHNSPTPSPSSMAPTSFRRATSNSKIYSSEYREDRTVALSVQVYFDSAEQFHIWTRHIYLYKHTHTGSFARTHTHTHTHRHTHTHARTHTHAYARTHTYTHTHARTHAHTHTHTHTHTQVQNLC